MSLKMQKVKYFGMLMICLVMFIGCHNVLEPVEKEATIVEDCAMTNIENDSLKISITDEGVIFFNGLQNQKNADKQNNLKALMEKYQSDKDYDLISLYKDFTGNQNVPEDIISLNDKIALLVQNSNNEDDCSENDSFSQMDAGPEVTKGVDTHHDLYKIDLYSEDSFIAKYKWCDHCWPRRTGYAYTQQKGRGTSGYCFTYRGTVLHKVRYRTGSWKAGPSNVVPKGYLSYLYCWTGLVRNYVKYEVTQSDGDGFHFASDYRN